MTSPENQRFGWDFAGHFVRGLGPRQGLARRLAAALRASCAFALSAWLRQIEAKRQVNGLFVSRGMRKAQLESLKLRFRECQGMVMKLMSGQMVNDAR